MDQWGLIFGGVLALVVQGAAGYVVLTEIVPFPRKGFWDHQLKDVAPNMVDTSVELIVWFARALALCAGPAFTTALCGAANMRADARRRAEELLTKVDQQLQQNGTAAGGDTNSSTSPPSVSGSLVHVVFFALGCFVTMIGPVALCGIHVLVPCALFTTLQNLFGTSFFRFFGDIYRTMPPLSGSFYGLGDPAEFVLEYLASIVAHAEASGNDLQYFITILLVFGFLFLLVTGVVAGAVRLLGMTPFGENLGLQKLMEQKTPGGSAGRAKNSDRASDYASAKEYMDEKMRKWDPETRNLAQDLIQHPHDLDEKAITEILGKRLLESGPNKFGPPKPKEGEKPIPEGGFSDRFVSEFRAAGGPSSGAPRPLPPPDVGVHQAFEDLPY